MSKATCPICTSAAEQIETEGPGTKTFSCQTHGEFDVSTAVLTSRSHMQASPNEWETALKIAAKNAAAGKRPRILKYDFHDLPLQLD